jgi:hypothetical protein
LRGRKLLKIKELGRVAANILKIVVNRWNLFADFGVVVREMPKYILIVLSMEIARNAFLANKSDVHEQVPNTNIKFICSEVREKMLFREGRLFMNFGPTPTSKLFVLNSKSRK